MANNEPNPLVEILESTTPRATQHTLELPKRRREETKSRLKEGITCLTMGATGVAVGCTVIQIDDPNMPSLVKFILSSYVVAGIAHLSLGVDSLAKAYNTFMQPAYRSEFTASYQYQSN